MFEELAGFFDASAMSAPDRRAQLVRWADTAVIRAADLRDCDSGPSDQLLKAACRVSGALASPDADEPQARETILVLCRYMEATAATLHELVIPSHEAQAQSAARDVEEAARKMLDWFEEGNEVHPSASTVSRATCQPAFTFIKGN